jgi:hypothetical protein
MPLSAPPPCTSQYLLWRKQTLRFCWPGAKKCPQRTHSFPALPRPTACVMWHDATRHVLYKPLRSFLMRSVNITLDGEFRLQMQRGLLISRMKHSRLTINQCKCGVSRVVMPSFRIHRHFCDLQIFNQATCFYISKNRLKSGLLVKCFFYTDYKESISAGYIEQSLKWFRA